jgi:response regulator NasT
MSGEMPRWWSRRPRVRASDAQEMQSVIDIVLRRFAEYHALDGAFGRRALTERAKGILMERHSIDEQAAFEMLRSSARERIANSSTLPRPS